jgi:hypothetical protein
VAPVLYHFSEDPGIEVFEPRTPAHRPDVEPLVWTVDEWHAPTYYFPRDCPRVLLWPLPTTTAEDRERWLGASSARMVAHIEAAWLERMHTTPVYRYTMPPETFAPLEGDPWMRVSREAVTPLRVEPVGDLVAALEEAGVELRVLERLTLLRDVWTSTLHASGIRLRHAQDWEGAAASPPPPSIARG